MSNLGTEVLRNAWDESVYAVVTRNKNNMRVSAEVYIKKADGKMSELYTVRKQDIRTKTNALDFLLDLEIDITKEDVLTIKNKINKLMKEENDRVQIQSRATLEEIHMALSKYIRENPEEAKDNPEPLMFVSGEYGYISSNGLDKFIKENKEQGFKRLELLKHLKIAGILKPASSRPYDVLVSIKGKKNWYYKILLHEEVEVEDIEMEVIAV